MSDYRNVTLRLGNNGLNVAVAPDLVKPGQFTRLTNIRTLREGQLTTRYGLHQIQTHPAAPVLLSRMAANAMLAVLDNGDVYRETTLLAIHTASPLDVTTARLTSSISGQTWTYLAAPDGMWKINNTTGDVEKWGISPPQGFPDVSGLPPVGPIQAGNLDALTGGTIPYKWVYTYFASKTNSESNPSAESDQFIPDASGVAYITNFVAPTDPQVDFLRIYRYGGTIAEFRLEDQIPIGTSYFRSWEADTVISQNPDLSYDNDVPFTTINDTGENVFETPIPTIWGPFNGQYIFACGDTFRPGYVYWTNAGNPDAASEANVLSVTSSSEALVSGFIFGANVFIFTRDNLYALDYGGPNALPQFVARQVPLGMGLSAPRGLAIGFNGVYFVSKDGIYETDCQSSAPESLTHETLRPLFLGKASGEFLPVDWSRADQIKLAFSGQELHFVYMDVAGEVTHLVYETLAQRWSHFDTTLGIVTTIYGDENQPQYRTIFGLSDGSLNELLYTALDDNSQAIAVNARTGSWDAEIPLTYKEWGNLIIDADCNGQTITVTPYVDAEGVQLTPWTLTGTGRQRYAHSLYDTYAMNLGVDFSWSGTATVYQAVVLFREDEEGIVHWEQPPTTFNLAGWKHIRDGYFALRSTADVTLTVTTDGVPKTYTLPSTNGQRVPVYWQSLAGKGKAFQFMLDSDQPFRLYGEDTFLYLKPWQTGNTYAPTPLGGPAPPATYLQNERGT